MDIASLSTMFGWLKSEGFVMILLIVGGCIAVVNSHEFMIELLEEQFEKIKFLKTYSLDK